MRVLIVGNLGYVGSVLVEMFSKLQHETELFGYDIAYFATDFSDQHTPLPERALKKQYYGDVRNFSEQLLDGIDAVIYLAAISNDPMGNEFEQVTYEVNYKACIRLATLSAKHKVKNFVFASSCSVYGDSNMNKQTEESYANPLTAYAKSKAETEAALKKLNTMNMVITCLRFATACGFSPRLRLDLVLNDFVANAIINKKIKLSSNGLSWRPLIHVKDMARALIWATQRKFSLGNFLILNVGSNKFNYQVISLAKTVQALIPDVEIIINKNPLPDKRSYQVDFSLFTNLTGNHFVKFGLEESIQDLVEGLEKMNFNNFSFQESNFIRLNKLRQYLQNKNLTSQLEWTDV